MSESVVPSLLRAAEADVEDVAALQVACAEDIAPAVEVLGFAARLVLLEPRIQLAAGTPHCHERRPRAVDLEGDGILTHNHANHL